MKIRQRCRDRGIEFLSSPFDGEAADFLYEIGLGAFKVASGEITNLPFLAHLGAMGRPLILSTGMADLAEVTAAVKTLRGAGADDIALLHCVSAYPAEPADCNLAAMKTLEDTFNVPVGWSDHTLGWEITVAAAALGARVIEKHLTLNADAPGPDHRFSLEPVPFAAMVAAVRAVESAIGDGLKAPRDCETDVTVAARKSLVAARNIRAGETLSREDVVARRPGSGLSPATLDEWLGRKISRDVGEGTLLKPDMFD
ncbi:MAG TPA: N-acetylneuraminate synthase, partial [Alphaproteobacteria bacterium]|nr:N-acetylneuraminate synthase [Alphaproteobacteria bacterium]